MSHKLEWMFGLIFSPKGTGHEILPKKCFIAFLRKNADIFAWKSESLPVITNKFALHHLNVDPKMKTVKKKKKILWGRKE